MSIQPQQFPGVFTAGDRLPAITGQFANTNITGWVITLLVKRPAPNALLTITATHLDELNGIFSFPWGAGDLVAGQGQVCEVVATNGGLPMTCGAFYIDVQPRLT